MRDIIFPGHVFVFMATKKLKKSVRNCLLFTDYVNLF